MFRWKGRKKVICDRTFFGAKELPVIDISKEALEDMARRNLDSGVAVPGVQKKLSLHLSHGPVARLTLVDYPAGYILKPQTEEYRNLPEAEDLVMDIADAAGIQTAPHGLIRIHDEWAYITKRVDRKAYKNGKWEMFAMEDFCQLSERLTQDKYKGSYEKCASIISRYSDRPGLDLAEFFMRLLICFVTGNSDMHLKNFSLNEIEPGERQFVLSPAYDLLPVNLVMPEDTEETALTLGGKKSRLKRKDFLALAERCKIQPHTAGKIIGRITGRLPVYIELCRSSFFPEDMKQDMITLMEERVRILDEKEEYD